MAKQRVRVRICDRCVRDTPAEDSTVICFENVTYQLDLCAKHATMMERDIMGWVRLGREAEIQHGPTKKWEPGEQFRSREKVVPPPPPKIVIDLDAGTEKPSTVETPVPKPAPPKSALKHERESELRLTNTGRTQMMECGLTWPQVCEAIDKSWAITGTFRDDVSAYLSDHLSVLVADDGSVLGMATREPVEVARTQQPTKTITRKGKRGGQGHIGPRTMPEIVAAIRATPGWSIDDTRKHYAVHGPNGERVTMPRTTSDYRSALNMLQTLRSVGLDLRAAHAS